MSPKFNRLMATALTVGLVGTALAGLSLSTTAQETTAAAGDFMGFQRRHQRLSEANRASRSDSAAALAARSAASLAAEVSART